MYFVGSWVQYFNSLMNKLTFCNLLENGSVHVNTYISHVHVEVIFLWSYSLEEMFCILERQYTYYNIEQYLVQTRNDCLQNDHWIELILLSFQ